NSSISPVWLSAFVGRIFLDVVNRIHPKGRNSLFNPEIDNIDYFLPKLWIFPIEVRLLLGKGVEIIDIFYIYLSPSRPTKDRPPVVWSLFPFSDNIIISVRTVLI